MKKYVFASLFALFFTVLSLCSFSTVYAQRPLPPNDRARGLIYDGLQPGDAAQCKGGFKVIGRSGKVLCTHGPDVVPLGYDINKRVPPAGIKVAYGSPDPVFASLSPLATVTCDGNGTTGNRVQVIYAHASDVPDNYATYAASFQQWVSGVDADFNNSAAQTGGTRHVRFVTDASCGVVIPDVTLSSTGDDTFANTINELEAMGYNRTDRKYLVFTDAHVYCGIATMAYDDSPSSSNMNNTGDTFGRIDAGCWSAVIPAHELMHQLGGVQFSAPHSDGNSHCIDGYDNMCDHSGHAVTTVCADTGMDNLFDCNHDDYYNTNPPAGSYLATRWNAANNVFLIVPQTARADSIVVGKMKGKTFTQTSTFLAGDTVILRVHVVDQKGANLSSVAVTLPVKRPDGSVQCSASGTTDSTGTAQVSCAIPRKTQKGNWDGHVNSLSKSGYTSDYTNSVMDKPFSVQ